MYNILELNAKTLDQLKAIATDMGIQKIDSSEKEDLVYKILDQQAIDMASKAASNSPAPKKRGPKPKKNIKEKTPEKSKEEENKSDAQSVEIVATNPDTGAEPKRNHASGPVKAWHAIDMAALSQTFFSIGIGAG